MTTVSGKTFEKKVDLFILVFKLFITNDFIDEQKRIWRIFELIIGQRNYSFIIKKNICR